VAWSGGDVVRQRRPCANRAGSERRTEAGGSDPGAGIWPPQQNPSLGGSESLDDFACSRLIPLIRTEGRRTLTKRDREASVTKRASDGEE